MKADGNGGNESWWFWPLFGASRPWAYLVAGTLLALFAAFQWWEVARDGWWPQAGGGVGFTGLAGLLLATGVAQARMKRSR